MTREQLELAQGEQEKDMRIAKAVIGLLALAALVGCSPPP